jgi:hypothetical protein
MNGKEEPMDSGRQQLDLQIDRMLQYIQEGWWKLRRSNRQLLQAAKDLQRLPLMGIARY